MTADELLEQMETTPLSVESNEKCIIDPETREIEVPLTYQLLGVESDEKVERIEFQCPRIVGDSIELSELQIRINFRNANQETDQYIVEDVMVDGENITFSWLLSRKVTAYQGTVSFIVCAVKISGDSITNEWNTTLAESEVLEGLEVDTPSPSEEQSDVIAQLLQIMKDTSDQAVEAVESAEATAKQAIQTEGTTQIGAVQQKGQEVLDSIPEDFTVQMTGKLDKNQGAENAGRIMTVGPDGNLFPGEEVSDIEKYIENYYAFRRTGKVYQTKIWKFATNPTSAGEKLLDNAGLVFEPSTDTEEGQDDYLNGQNPLFEWCNVNYVRDTDGSPKPVAIEGMSNYKTTGSVDVGTMQMSFWWKWDASNPEYDLITISDTPHPELELVPWVECVKADRTVLPWCIGSKYISGIASDGLLRSQPGLKPERNQSHNNMITNYQKKGEGYWGAGACRNTFQIIFTLIKGATKSTQTLFAGVTSHNFQYQAAIESADNHTYFPVTNVQAANILVGTYVSVGYGGNNKGTANNDRGQTTIHAYADNVKVLRKEALEDGMNTAIYLDIPEESAFSTQPHVYTGTFSAPIMISSMHAWSGATDAVRGRHDGSPVSNTDSKHPYRVQGREYAVGGYIVASDTVALLNADGIRTIYVAEKGVDHSSSDATIKSTYKIAGTIPVNSSGSAADFWIGDDGFDMDTGAWYPAKQGSGNSQGVGDMYYAGGEANNALREYSQGGSLGDGSHAGASYLHLSHWLGNGYWYLLGCD